MSSVESLKILSSVLGWIYFACWTVSFIPQIYLNQRTRNVEGLSLDAMFYSIVGFIAYLIYTCAMMFSPAVNAQYKKRFKNQANTVQINDFLFSIIAVLATFIIIGQIFQFKTKQQKMSFWAILINISFILSVGIFYLVVLLYNGHGSLLLLDFIYYLGIVKTVTTIIKCIPQIHYNYKRKSTEGFSISQVLLDLTGGILSIFQLFVDSAIASETVTTVKGDLAKGIEGNAVKLLLGLVSIGFDGIYMFQHYILYRKTKR